MLRTENFAVFPVEAGEEGVQLGRLNEHDLILLDLNFPDMSGYDVLCSLRRASVKTPVLILSGLASIQDKVRGLGFGADDYLDKAVPQRRADRPHTRHSAPLGRASRDPRAMW